MNLAYKCVRFYELSLDELYEIMVLRQEIFVVEQNCPFVDADGKDQVAYHFLVKNESNQLVAYTRLFGMDVYYDGFTSIGRVVSSSKVRGKGIGKILMQKSIEKTYQLFGNQPIKIGAQKYLEKFYQSFGFKSTNEDYLEDGILHTIMIL